MADDHVLDELIHAGELIPAGARGGVSALLAVEPVPAGDDTDTAAVVSELRGERLGALGE
jgi:hypothetical protein